ncbi:MAG: putative ABC transporter permease [Candidatus Saccharibacteria bacterium]|nr:putative ABC transporter permease [Candidatus Saccharibacteria bacterium]
MNINNIPEYFIWFIIYSFLGWAWETLITSIPQRRFVNRGFLNGPYCPIYGAGALLFIFFTNNIDSIAVRFILGAVIACTLEYLTSWVLELIFHARWWDYAPRRFNLNGRICLEGFFVFGLGAVVAPYFHQNVANITAQLSPALLNSIFSIILITFIVDVVITNRALSKFNRILREYQKAIDKRRLDFLEFIRRGRRVFEMRIGKNNRIRDVLSFQQRRILDAFPHFDSTLYEEALSRLRKLNSDSRRNVIIERKSQMPEKQKSRSARKKARQKATERARAKRRN